MVKEQPQNQQGSALIVSLIFLLLLTLLSVAGIKSSTSQERMAANVKLKSDSFQAAESALRLIQYQLSLAASDNKPLPNPCTGASCNTIDAVFDPDATGTPGAGWVQIPSSTATNHMEVWYRITSLGETLAPANTVNAENAYEGPGNLYRIVVVSFRGSTRTVLESVYVHYAV
jgi:type IV pilus assembly protein PilX